MAKQTITFTFLTGISQQLFLNAKIQGSWDVNGLYSDTWTTSPMTAITGEDGCPAFATTIDLDLSEAGQVFNWGVFIDGPAGKNLWGINTEVNDPAIPDRYSSFTLMKDGSSAVQQFYFTYKKKLGANKFYITTGDKAGLKFCVWSPNAEAIDVVFGDASGYITVSNGGINNAMPEVSLTIGKLPGVWESAVLPNFDQYAGKYYMYRITTAQGLVLYRTDIFARGLVGRGQIDPEASAWDGTIQTLDGTVSCSIITDPDLISSVFPLPVDGDPKMESTEDFWKQEFDPAKPLPGSIDDMVIYELHVGALGNTPGVPGNLQDAIDLLDYLVDLGINAIELLPMSEFSGTVGWGYGDTHHMVIQSSAGGRDEYRYFIRECHRRGIAVIQDVVYNHYDSNANRAEWAYDSAVPEQNIYYFYEGKSNDYPNQNGGYCNNGGTGYTPNFRETIVRQQFISSAVFLAEEMHVDGFRVDLCDAIHLNNTQNSPPYWGVNDANAFGCKFLREWGRTLRMTHPNIMLMAEDYTGWDMMTKPVSVGGCGFNAIWYANFFHALIGYQGSPMLLLNEGYGDDRQLDIAGFSANLYQTQFNSVVYHSNHDNSGACLDPGNNVWSHRTMVTAVNEAPIIGSTREYAEMRSRVVAALSVLSAGTPLFFMGEEITAQKPYTYNGFLSNREDLKGDRLGVGANMFRYYQDLLTLSKRYQSIRSKSIDILTADSPGRVIIFKRWYGTEQVIIAASFNNSAYSYYTVNADSYRLPDGGWKEVFNSDADVYGGTNIGNAGAVIPSLNGSLTMTIPANGLVVLVKN